MLVSTSDGMTSVSVRQQQHIIIGEAKLGENRREGRTPNLHSIHQVVAINTLYERVLTFDTA